MDNNELQLIIIPTATEAPTTSPHMAVIFNVIIPALRWTTVQRRSDVSQTN